MTDEEVEKLAKYWFEKAENKPWAEAYHHEQKNYREYCRTAIKMYRGCFP